MHLLLTVVVMLSADGGTRMLSLSSMGSPAPSGPAQLTLLLMLLPRRPDVMESSRAVRGVLPLNARARGCCLALRLSGVTSRLVRMTMLRLTSPPMA